MINESVTFIVIHKFTTKTLYFAKWGCEMLVITLTLEPFLFGVKPFMFINETGFWEPLLQINWHWSSFSLSSSMVILSCLILSLHWRLWTSCQNMCFYAVSARPTWGRETLWLCVYCGTNEGRYSVLHSRFVPFIICHTSGARLSG